MEQDEHSRDEVLATVQASAGRRLLGIGSLWILGALVVYVALAEPPAFIWQVFLLGLGASAFWIAERMRRATLLRIELTRDVLRDSSGSLLAPVAEIESVDRGVFAFKPSNGFLIRTTNPGARTWRPGLWWRLGRRIGVGGMTPGSQTKYMADILSAMIAER